jgi:hypothetical protein
MLSNFLKNHITSQAAYVEYGYGQVEPNHLSAQRTSQVYAQLPAAADIKVLEQGQFVKYDYANNLVNFTGVGEWMLVYNEIKLYREHQDDCEFAMVKDNYQARVYSPFGSGVDKDGNPTVDEVWDRQARFLNGVEPTEYDNPNGGDPIKLFGAEDVTAAPDMYEIHYNEDPMKLKGPYKEAMMPTGTTMVPRVFKTNIGDIYTTNTIGETALVPGDILAVGANGILTKTPVEKSDTFAGSGDMRWQVVKVYTMPDHQKGVKIMRIA